jgi:hypothetical protein
LRRVAAALCHHPVLDRDRRIVTTAITNLDLHDIARSAHSYGLTDFFVTHPIAAQRELALRVREHWTTGSGAKRIPDRKPPMEALRIVKTLSDAIDELGGLGQVELWTTSAQAAAKALHFAAARELLRSAGGPVLLVFGTGWGLSDEVLAMAHHQLESVRSPRADGYNHLSVRAAAAIIFDRLLGVH